MAGIRIGLLKGIGEKKEKGFYSMGIRTTDDLFRFLPRDYLDYTRESAVSELRQGKTAAVRVRFLSDGKFARVHGMTIVTATATDGISRIKAVWFNQPYRRNQVHAGETKLLLGRADLRRGITMQNPTITDTLPGLVPVYPVTREISQRTIRDAQKEALRTALDMVEDDLPEQIRKRYDLIPLGEAFQNVHAPASPESLRKGRRRLVFDNLLCYLLAVEMEQSERKRALGIAFDTAGTEAYLASLLPFELTGAQKRVISEIEKDMQSQVPMNRLVQGDVGSGKTVVALYALLNAKRNGKQAAFLAPTEVLAKQHYDFLRPFFPDIRILTGGMKKAERTELLADIKNGRTDVIVGTHALLQGDVAYNALGVVVTDEQHRFGVSQRAQMEQKGTHPDVLVMSATPIPRTLAMLLYGDLDVSSVDELPPGRKPVKTSFIPFDRREDMYEYVKKQAEAGFQTYVVCPFIEESEELDGPNTQEVFRELSEKLSGVAVGLLHGRMKQKEKEEAIQKFRDGETKVLVTTTVIEVGVDVKKATTMIIEGADRFGLAQMHQLRGRVGRGEDQAYCFLLSGSETDTAKKRFDILTGSSDGFCIAEQDLAMRGPGDFLGTRQHGDGDSNLLRDAADLDLVKSAKQAAQEIMEMPTVLNNAFLKSATERYLQRTERLAMN